MSLNAEDPTGLCECEPAAALQRGENEVTGRWGGGGVGRCVSSKRNQKMMGVSASGYDRGVWKDHGCGHFPQDKRAVM